MAQMNYTKLRSVGDGRMNLPVLSLSEFDEDRWEMRKVDVFVDGRMCAASEDFDLGVGLAVFPLPPDEDYLGDRECVIEPTDAEEFERFWAQARSELFYRKVRRVRPTDLQPLFVLAELDGRRYEVRRLYIYPDGRTHFDSAPYGGVAWEQDRKPWPSDEVLAADPELAVEPTSAQEFDALWDPVVQASDRESLRG